MLTVTPLLWFDSQAEEAMNLYTSIFPRSKVISVNRAQGRVMMVQLELEGQKIMGLNAGPMHQFTEAVSFFVGCETQQEVDELWTKLTADGGRPGRCGWLEDRFGLSSLCYVATWEVVYFKITPNFMESSSAHAVAKARASGASEEAIAKKKTEMAEFAQMYRNPPINAGITFMEPLPVALIVSLISAGALSRRRKPGIAADPAVRGAPAAR